MNLLSKIAGIINNNKNVRRDILLAKKHRLQGEFHKASEERNFTKAEQIGNELLEVNRTLDN